MAKGDIDYLENNNKDASIEVENGEQQRATLIIDAGEELRQSALKIPIDQFFAQDIGLSTFLTVAAVIDGRQITVDDPSNFSIGDVAVLGQAGVFYAGTVLGVAGSVVSLDTLINFPFSIGCSVQSRTRDINVDGSSSVQRFSVSVPISIPDAKINICNLIMECLTDSAVDLSKFGDIDGGLTLGIMLRGVPDPLSGISPSNSWNAKNNGELANLAGSGDFEVFSALNPAQGQDGFVWRYTYGGPEKHDVIPSLQNLDEIQLIVQDNLVSLTKLTMIYRGNGEP
jgi:hypothetical protein